MQWKSLLLCLVVFCRVFVNCAIIKAQNNKRVCVIGAGIAGLSLARYMKEDKINFIVLEATRYVGGTWRYDPRVGTDENGLMLHTSMYKHLRTNLPKPTMELRGFPLPEELPSFPSWKNYYEYLQRYAEYFDLEKYIKFLHNVVKVTREGDVWKVKHEHVITGKIYEDEYDYVIVGTGHFTKPNMPNIPGEEKFKGTIIHSHDYREPEPYTGRRVLLVGAGPSGMDIGLDVAEFSQTLIHSQHSKVNFRTPFPPNYVKKPDIKEFNETGAIFVDGTFEEFDDVIYCTGFEYYYPFLDETSGLSLHPRSVIPLYRYMVNIHQPTMVIMGLVVRACLVIALDAQARYVAALVKGNFTLPPEDVMMQEWQKRADVIRSKGLPMSHIHMLAEKEARYVAALVKGNFTLPPEDVMMQEWQKRADVIRSKGLPMSHIHMLAEKEDQYYAELSEESGIERVPPVMFKIRAVDTEAKLENLYTYRNYVYTVIDDQTFTRHLEGQLRNSTLDP